jgi:DNA-binding response OmpR family regulator
MSSATVHRLTQHATAVRSGAPPQDHGADAPRILVVPPGEVPHDAVLLGHVVAFPAHAARAGDRPARIEAGPGLVVDGVSRRVVRDGQEVALTRREFDLLLHLVSNAGQVLTRAQLLSTVWDLPHPAYAPRRTVDVHVARLRRKLGARAVPLQSLRGVGYRWAERTRPLGGPA